MKKKSFIYVIWAVWYLCCLLLSMGAEPSGMAKVPFVVVGITTYAPPLYLLYLSKKDAKTIKLVRTISIASLATFVVLYALNIMSVNWSAAAGTVLYYMMVVLCAPVMCGQFFIVSLYLWGCLLWACILMLKKLNRPDQM